MSVALSSDFTLSFPRQDKDGKSRVYSKYVAVVCSGTQKFLVDNGKFVTNPEILTTDNEPYPIATSIKGLQVQHGAINMAFNNMLTISDHGADSIPYTYQGKIYYFRKNQIELYDNQIKSMTNNGMIVNAILIMYRTGMNDSDSQNKDIIHPDANDKGTVYAVNLTNEIGVRYYEALMSFITTRYSRADKLYGRLHGYIVGNEVGQNRIWNNMGDKLIDDYVEQYERQVRMTYAISKQAWSQSRTYISLDHFWNAGISDTDTGTYDNKK